MTEKKDPTKCQWVDAQKNIDKQHASVAKFLEESRRRQGLMFGFVTTKPINPIGGKCIHGCRYGYCGVYTDLYRMKKYQDPKPVLYVSELNKLLALTKDDLCFVSDMNDLFAENVPADMIGDVLEAVGCSAAKILLLTKNPARMAKFIDDIPKNCIVGMTAETNRGTTSRWSRAPLPFDRFAAFTAFVDSGLDRMVSIEPIADFDLPQFSSMILRVKPKLVAIGYNNYNDRYRLPEPYLTKTVELIELLKLHDIDVHIKTLRERLQ